MKGLIALVFPLILSACSSSLTKEAQVDFYSDDLGVRSLAVPLAEDIRLLESNPEGTVKIADKQYDKKNYVAKLRLVQKFIELYNDKVATNDLIHRLFNVVEVKSDRDDHEILMTSYYSPVIKGSSKKTEQFSTAIYKKPENTSFSRAEIMTNRPYDNKGLELFYLDPIEAFFLHVQGSGSIELENGEVVHVAFDGSNGKAYTSLGKELSARGIMEKEKVTLASLETYLRSLSPADLEKTLAINESYIFFKLSDKKSLTTFGSEASPGRTIATDGALFSKGLLAYLEFRKPVFEENKVDFVPTSRFVLDQDTGSAIKGSGRVDLFWGEGEAAKTHAGVVKEKVKLYYLVPKE